MSAGTTEVPGITVVIPVIPPRTGPSGTYERAVRSVQAQTRPPAKILVELDVDRTGAAATRNRLLERVTTEWVAFLDDDDELYPDHLRLLLRFARLTRADVVYPGYDTTGTDEINCFGLPFDSALLAKANFIPVTALARTQTVRDAGGFQPHADRNGDPCEDWGLWLAMHRAGAKFAHLPVKTWRWHNDRPTTRGRPERR